ncbi:MAG: hypothetical protein ACFFD4_29855 [Candidatus Odinarchaeota archaeon]
MSKEKVDRELPLPTASASQKDFPSKEVYAKARSLISQVIFYPDFSIKTR